ncbi:SRPBCC family protein [Poriferisphaera sp. WC338]|uniref:SRPBCC family protein n=1 Tax=Poriferisphaera sp. WC338 TaxID=3425129 RepID=UPI003D81944C
MKKFLIGGLVTVVTLILIVVVVGLFLPNDFRVARTVTVNATADTIHPYVNDLNQWNQWEPWTKVDPTIVTTLGNQAVGVGANHSWVGQESGSGSLVITQSSPDSGVTFDVTIDEHGSTSQAAIIYASSGDTTEVTWQMTGKIDVPVIGGYLCMMMDGQVGHCFEYGLDRLKTISESSGTTTPTSAQSASLPE